MVAVLCRRSGAILAAVRQGRRRIGILGVQCCAFLAQSNGKMVYHARDARNVTIPFVYCLHDDDLPLCWVNQESSARQSKRDLYDFVGEYSSQHCVENMRCQLTLTPDFTRAGHEYVIKKTTFMQDISRPRTKFHKTHNPLHRFRYQSIRLFDLLEVNLVIALAYL